MEDHGPHPALPRPRHRFLSLIFPVLIVEEIEFQYPRSPFGLRIERFESRAGSATAIVGPSGCGKTTFLNLAAGILQPQKGSIRLEDTTVSNLGVSASATYRLAHIGLIFQEFELVEHLSVRDNILLPLHLGLHADRTALEARASASRSAARSRSTRVSFLPTSPPETSTPPTSVWSSIS